MTFRRAYSKDVVVCRSMTGRGCPTATQCRLYAAISGRLDFASVAGVGLRNTYVGQGICNMESGTT